MAKAPARKPGQFEPGNQLSIGNGGPNSSRRGKITQQLISQLNERYTSGRNKGMLRLDVVVNELIKNAERGDIIAAKEIFDRVEGKARQSVEISGRNGGPIAMITAQTTLAEAAQMYADTLRAVPDADESDDDE